MRQRSRHTHAQVQLRSYKAFRRVAAPPPVAQRFLSSLHPDRREFLLTHGILLVQLPTSRAPRNTLTWIVPPEDGALVEAHWYTDGSLLDGQVAATTAFSTVGFGVLAVDERNVVVAAGYGTPPRGFPPSQGSKLGLFASHSSTRSQRDPSPPTACQSSLPRGTPQHSQRMLPAPSQGFGPFLQVRSKTSRLRSSGVRRTSRSERRTPEQNPTAVP